MGEAIASQQRTRPRGPRRQRHGVGYRSLTVCLPEPVADEVRQEAAARHVTRSTVVAEALAVRYPGAGAAGEQPAGSRALA